MRHHINKSQDKNHTIISIDDAEKAWQNSTSIHDKNSYRSVYRGNISQKVKAIYDKSTDKVVLNGEKPKGFPLKSGTRQGCPLSPLLFNVILEVPATEIRQEKEIKGI